MSVSLGHKPKQGESPVRLRTASQPLKMAGYRKGVKMILKYWKEDELNKVYEERFDIRDFRGVLFTPMHRLIIKLGTAEIIREGVDSFYIISDYE